MCFGLYCLFFLADLGACSSLRVRGLITLAAHTDDRDRIRECLALGFIQQL